VGHPGDGLLRRALDEPLALTPEDRAHLRSCDRCAARMREIEENAGFAATLFAAPTPAVDTRRALSAVMAATETKAGGTGARLLDRLRVSRPRIAAPLGGLAAAVALVGALALTPAGSLAQDVVAIFQPQQVAPISLSTDDLKSLSQLRQYGTVQMPQGTSAPSPTSNATTAAQEANVTLLVPPSLPADVSPQVRYQVVPSKSASFTFSAARATAWAQQQGKTIPTMPAGLDGSSVTVKTGNAVVALYGSADAEAPNLVIGQMPAPHISTTGVSYNTMEDYILGMPGISPQLASEIRALGNPAETLPLPVPVDFASAQSVTVRGVHGYAVGDNTGLFSVVVWEQNGTIYGVGGTVSEQEAMQIANSLTAS
jgi:hypothetical protein